MPLDTGAVTETVRVAEAPAAGPPVFDAAPSVGAALRAMRLYLGLSLESVADTTRIRKSYLQAIEAMAPDQLPPRPFAIGYVRAYAQTLGLDVDATVRRYRAEVPDPEQALRAPVGILRERDPRLATVAVAAAVVIGAIVVWNVARRTVAEDYVRTAPTIAAAPKLLPISAPAPVTLGAPLPAPPESTTPAPYVTPGLEAETASTEPAVQADPAGTPFVPKGVIYGAPAGASGVVLQAKKAALLVVRGPDGSVYFARQLSPGQAYRAPQANGLVADVSDPSAIAVYVGGAFRGPLAETLTPLSKLAG